MTTRTPLAANAFAVAAPRPAELAVTSATDCPLRGAILKRSMDFEMNIRSRDQKGDYHIHISGGLLLVFSRLGSDCGVEEG